MPTPAKLLHVLGLLAKEEAVYGTAIALTTTADGVQLQYKDRHQGAPLTFKYAYDGSLGPSVGALGQVRRVPPSGYSIEGDLPTRARPAGAAYSATVLPSIHRLLKAAGFDATIVTTATLESVTYAPTVSTTTFTSLSMGLYTRGELWAIAGAICSAKFDFSNPEPPIWTFATRGIATLPIDAVAPIITYPNQSVQSPLASSIGVTLGSLTANAVVMSGGFDMARSVDNPRVALSAAGAHLGYTPGDRIPVCKVVLEATALVGTPFTSSSAFDPYNLKDKATQFAFALQFGAIQYNKWTLNFPQAQVIDAVPNNNGPIATVELTIAGFNSTATSADDMNIVFN